jgi:phage gp45-like
MSDSALSRLMAPIARRMRLMVSRAVVELVNDATRLQAVQVSLLSDEVRDSVERFQEYGFTSVPLPGAEAVALSVSGNRDHVVVVATDDRRYRKIGLQPGEVAIYNNLGDYAIFRAGSMEVRHSTRIDLTAPVVAVSGNLTVGGTIVATGQITGAGKNLSTHVHTGVTSGGSNTGAPA